MPRQFGTGIYSPPPNLTAIPSGVIESGDWNALIADLTAVMNSPWPVSLGGTGVGTLTGFIGAIGGVAKIGDTMTGPLTLNGNPTSALHAAPKQFVESVAATKASLAHTHPKADLTDFDTNVDARIAAASINALADVNVSSAVAGHTLIHDGTIFKNRLPYTEYNKGVFSPGVRLTQAHGLGRVPTAFDVYIKFNTAANEWAVGDMIPISAFGASIAAGYFPTYMNATEVGFSPRVTIIPTPTQKITLGDGDSIPASSINIIFRVFE